MAVKNQVKNLEFRTNSEEKLAFITGTPKQGFFGNPELAAEITKIDTKLIQKFGTISDALCSTHFIAPNNFIIMRTAPHR